MNNLNPRQNYNKIGNWLVTKRRDKGLTQEYLARLINQSRTCYANIETGARRPSVTVAKKIADVLGFDWTLFFEDQKSQ